MMSGASGATVSTVKSCSAGVGSALPAASVALTLKACEPLARPAYSCGEVQLMKGAPSRLHLKVEPASEEENEKLAETLLLAPSGPESMEVSGGVASGVEND